MGLMYATDIKKRLIVSTAEMILQICEAQNHIPTLAVAMLMQKEFSASLYLTGQTQTLVPLNSPLPAHSNPALLARALHSPPLAAAAAAVAAAPSAAAAPPLLSVRFSGTDRLLSISRLLSSFRTLSSSV